jgi:hypothetical protein
MVSGFLDDQSSDGGVQVDILIGENRVGPALVGQYLSVPFILLEEDMQVFAVREDERSVDQVTASTFLLQLDLGANNNLIRTVVSIVQ